VQQRRVAVSPGQPFNIDENIEYNSISGSWVNFGNAVPGKAVRVQGIYWSCTTVGASIKIRDVRPANNPSVVWYDAVCVGGAVALDQFASHLTLFAPFQYYVSGSSGDTIIIYGEYL
jgi:hypothetical protein